MFILISLTPPPNKQLLLTVGSGDDPLFGQSSVAGYLNPSGYEDIIGEGYSSFGTITNDILFEKYKIIGLYSAQTNVLILDDKDASAPNTIMCTYDDTKYAPFIKYDSSYDITIYTNSSQLDNVENPISDLYFMPYIGQTIPIRLFDKSSNSTKVQISFYFGSSAGIRAVDTSNKWYLCYSDDLDQTQRQLIYQGEMEPTTGSIITTFEVDAYRDCFIYKQAGYGGVDECIALANSNQVLYDPASYHFIVTKSCSVGLA